MSIETPEAPKPSIEALHAMLPAFTTVAAPPATQRSRKATHCRRAT